MSNEIDWAALDEEVLYQGQESFLLPHSMLTSIERWNELRDELPLLPSSLWKNFMMDLLIFPAKVKRKNVRYDLSYELMEGMKFWCGPYGSLGYFLLQSLSHFGEVEELSEKALVSYKSFLPPDTRIDWTGSISVLSPIRKTIERLEKTDSLLSAIRGDRSHPLMEEVDILLAKEGYVSGKDLGYLFVHEELPRYIYRLYPLLSHTLRKLGGVLSDTSNGPLQALNQLYLLYFDSAPDDLYPDLFEQFPIGGYDLFLSACAMSHLLERSAEGIFYAGWTLSKAHNQTLQNLGGNMLVSVGGVRRFNRDLFL